MKKIKFYLSAIFLIILNVDYAGAAALGTGVSEEINKQVGAFNRNANFASNSIGSIMALVIKSFLGLLGIIFLILIIYAGYNWMTAAGEEEKVKKAKETIQRALIGLIIVISAYAITYFVFKNLGGAGGAGGAGGSRQVFQ